MQSFLHRLFLLFFRGHRPQNAPLLPLVQFCIQQCNAIAVLATCPSTTDYPKGNFAVLIIGLDRDLTRTITWHACSCANRSDIHYIYDFYLPSLNNKKVQNHKTVVCFAFREEKLNHTITEVRALLSAVMHDNQLQNHKSNTVTEVRTFCYFS
jgi:hypothetical protein